MKTIIFSIIIPHYNIPELLVRCLKSIPIREDIQVIVVDDCSPGSENYLSTIPELSRPFVEFYSTSQGGSAGRARNVGIEHAKGRWLTFVDADDLFVNGAAQILERYRESNDDVLYFPSKSVMCNDLSKPSNRHCFLYHFEQYKKTGNENLLRYEFDAPWGKFVKKSLIDEHHIRFDEVRWSNDTFFSAAIGVYAKTIDVPDEVLYIVTEREGSLTSAKVMSVEEWTTRFRSALHVQDFFDQNAVSYKRYAFVEFLDTMRKRDRRIFWKEFAKLSFVNKCRYIYCKLRLLR